MWAARSTAARAALVIALLGALGGEGMAKPAQRVITVERVWPPLVQIQVQLPSGALADPKGGAGLAHLSWQVALEAAGKRKHRAFAAALDGLGARLDAQVGRRTTTVVASAPAAHAEAVVALLADVVLRPRLGAADFKRLKALEVAAVREELDDDALLAESAATRYLFRGLALGRPAGGTAESLSSLKLADVRAFHAAAIAAPLRFGFSGPLPRLDALALIDRYFSRHRSSAGKSKGKGHKAARNRTMRRPRLKGRRLLLLDRPGRSQAHVVALLPTAGVAHRSMPALAVAVTAFGGAYTSRLVHQLRELRGWTYSVDATVRGGPRHGVFSLSWTPDNRACAASLDLVMRMLERLRAHGLTPAELSFARAHLRGAHSLAMETAEAELDERMRALALGLPIDYPQKFGALIGAVTVKGTQDALRAWLDPAAAAVVVVGDARTLLPRLQALRSGFVVEVLPYTGAPEKTQAVGRRVAHTPAGPSEGPIGTDDIDSDHGDDDGEEIGPAFDEEGNLIDGPPPLPQEVTAAAVPPGATPTDPPPPTVD